MDRTKTTTGILWTIVALAITSVAVIAFAALVGPTVPLTAQIGAPPVSPRGPNGEVFEEPFFTLPNDQTAALKAIVLRDPQIQAVLASNDYDYVVDVGARIQTDNMSPEKLFNWMKSGQKDTSLIREYVGVLNFGYNDSYTFSIDVPGNKLSQITKRVKGTVPNVTRAEKASAKALVMSSPAVQSLLVGKGFVAGSDAKGNGSGVMVSQKNEKLGMFVEIRLDKTYAFDTDMPYLDSSPEYPFPYYVEQVRHFSGEASRLTVFVSLAEGKILGIIPMP